MSNIVANDPKQHLNVRKMIESTKKDEIIYATDNMLNDYSTLFILSWPSTTDILAMMSLLISCITLLGFAVLYCKLKPA